MPDFFDLTSRHALVTGATRGIGLAVAQALAARNPPHRQVGRWAFGGEGVAVP